MKRDKEQKEEIEVYIPASLLPTAQEAAISIELAIPTPLDALPALPVDPRHIIQHLRIPPLHFLSPLGLRARLPPPELGQRAREALEVLLAWILRHVARQDPADAYHGGSVRAYQ